MDKARKEMSENSMHVCNVSKLGIIGDATKASKEKRKILAEAVVKEGTSYLVETPEQRSLRPTSL